MNRPLPVRGGHGRFSNRPYPVILVGHDGSQIQHHAIVLNARDQTLCAQQIGVIVRQFGFEDCLGPGSILLARRSRADARIRPANEIGCRNKVIQSRSALKY